MRYCPKCQVETERNAAGRCKPCKHAISIAWQKANPAKEKARKAAYYAANSEKLKACSAAYYSANHEKVKANSSAWQKANPEKHSSNGAIYREQHRDSAKAATAAWRRDNPESCMVNDHNRHARERANGGKLSQGLAAKIFKLQRGRCPCCKQPLGNDYHLDHKMPIKLGGANEDWNMQLLRKTCNLQKNAKHPIAFMQSRGFLL